MNALIPRCPVRSGIDPSAQCEALEGHVGFHQYSAPTPQTEAGRSLADGEEDGLTALVVAIEEEAAALALAATPTFDDALSTARSVLSELKVMHGGTAAIAAAGRIVREIEALR